MSLITAIEHIVMMNTQEIDCLNSTCNSPTNVALLIKALLNQARAWFLEIISVRMYACVCVSAPEAMND